MPREPGQQSYKTRLLIIEPERSTLFSVDGLTSVTQREENGSGLECPTVEISKRARVLPEISTADRTTNLLRSRQHVNFNFNFKSEESCQLCGNASKASGSVNFSCYGDRTHRKNLLPVPTFVASVLSWRSEKMHTC